MKFVVTRTSRFMGKPCKEAKLEPVVRLDIRTVSDPAKLGSPEGRRDWYKKGKNHRVEQGHIVREFDDRAWFVEINSLDELLAFKEKYGQLIVGDYLFNHTIPSIEIYDGYRE